MIGTHTGQVVSFQIPWMHGREDAPTFLLRVGSLTERDLFEAELDGQFDAGEVYSHAIRAAVITGIEALGGDDAPALIDLANAYYSDQADDMPASERAKMVELLGILQEHWPAYRQLAAQSAKRLKLMPTLAFQRWCVGWENMTDAQGEALPFIANKVGRPDDEAVRRLPPLFLLVAGTEAWAMQSGRGEVKNSVPRSESDATPENSPAAEKVAKAGASTVTSGKRTRRSSSRAQPSA